MESVTSKPSAVMPGIGAAVSVIVHSTAPTVAADASKPLTPKPTRVTQHKVGSDFGQSWTFTFSRRITTDRNRLLPLIPSPTLCRIISTGMGKNISPRSDE